MRISLGRRSDHQIRLGLRECSPYKSVNNFYRQNTYFALGNNIKYINRWSNQNLLVLNIDFQLIPDSQEM